MVDAIAPLLPLQRLVRADAIARHSGDTVVPDGDSVQLPGHPLPLFLPPPPTTMRCRPSSATWWLEIILFVLFDTGFVARTGERHEAYLFGRRVGSGDLLVAAVVP
jgi:hypothetical protein